MKYKLMCVEEHCEWANNRENHCIWPREYCPKQKKGKMNLILIDPMRVPDWVMNYIRSSPDTEKRGKIWMWKRQRAQKGEIS